MRAYLQFFLILGLCTEVTAAPRSLSIAEIYDLAKTAAPELAIARYQVDGAEAQKDVALGQILPQVVLFGQYSKNHLQYDNNYLYEDQTYPGERYGLQVRQTLLNVADGLEINRRALIQDQREQELKIAENKLLSDLVQTYLNVLLADADLLQIESELTALERQLKEADALYEKSLLPLTELLEIKARRDSLKADVIGAKGNKAVKQEELFQLTGDRDVVPKDVKDSFSLLVAYKTAEEAGRRAVISSFSVAGAEAALAAAEKGVDKELSTWIPELELTYSYQHSDVGFDNLRSPPRDTSTIAVGFNYPLFEGGAGSARLREARAEYNAARSNLLAEQRKSEARARAAFLNLESLTERVLAARQAVTSADSSVDAARKSATLGVARATDVLLALAQRTRARRDLILAKFQFAMGWVELELATGASPNAIVPTLSRAMHRE